MSNKNSAKKYIFVSGGVISGLGKGVTAASLGFLLENRGFKVTNIKCENYLNLDSGNINPAEHGDVFLCEDGTEADLDLGTYERFLGHEVGALNYTTIGQIYQKVIDDAKHSKFNGATVEAIPYVPEEVIRRIEAAAADYDICLVELGGTAGEYQNVIYFEAYRIMKLRCPGDVIHVHVTYFPKPDHLGELKSKPTQLSVQHLQGMGIQPDFVVGRSPVEIDAKRKAKVAYFCNMLAGDVISNPDLDSIYQLPLEFAAQDFDQKALTKLGLPSGQPDLSQWQAMVNNLLNPVGQEVTVGIVCAGGDSTRDELADSYASLVEALRHAASANQIRLKVEFVLASKLEKNHEQISEILQPLSGIVIPDSTSTEGLVGQKIAIAWAREHKTPFLGIGVGLQLVISEAAQSTNQTDLVITENAAYLGGHYCLLKLGSLVDEIYASTCADKNNQPQLVSERYRGRRDFSPLDRAFFEKANLVVSGTLPDGQGLEIVELEKTSHPFFVALTAHPEYKSQPLHPHCLFVAFLRAGAKSLN